MHLPFKCSDPVLSSLLVDGDNGGGQCCADSASQRSPSSCAVSLSQSLLITTSLYSGLFDFNHCRAVSTLAGRTCSVPYSTASFSVSLEPSEFEREALAEGYILE